MSLAKRVSAVSPIPKRDSGALRSSSLAAAEEAGLKPKEASAADDLLSAPPANNRATAAAAALPRSAISAPRVMTHVNRGKTGGVRCVAPRACTVRSCVCNYAC